MARNPKPIRNELRGRKAYRRVCNKWFEKLKAFKPGMAVVHNNTATVIKSISYLIDSDVNKESYWTDSLSDEAGENLNSVFGCNVYMENGNWDNIANVDWFRKIGE